MTESLHEITELSAEQLQRYRGHLSLHEIGYAGQLALARARVLIVGAGGLGSPVALYLAAAGVGHIGIVDADVVSLSNLQRQIIHGTPDVDRPKVESAKESLAHINPGIEVTTYEQFLTPENAADIISQYDIVADCTDNLNSRLLVNDVCLRLSKPYAFGAVSRCFGQVFTHVPGSCTYRDIFGEPKKTDEVSCALNGILNTVVGVVGTLQATEVVKYITGIGQLLTDAMLMVDVLTMTFTKLKIR